MKQTNLNESKHADSIQTTKPHKISHTRRWIELCIVMIVVAILAIIVIPTITTISKSADYSKAFDRSTTIIKAFEVANADAKYQSIAIPNTTISFSSNQLDNAVSNTNQTDYETFIAKQLQTYLVNATDKDFTFNLIKTPAMVVLFYWDKANHATSSNDTDYSNPNYVCIVQNQTTKMLTYDEFLNLNLLPENT